MKRREFLKNSAGAAATMLPLTAFGQSRPCPPGQLSATGGTSATTSCVKPGDLEADWIARATSPGVIWAHDFRHPNELQKFVSYTGEVYYGPGNVGGNYDATFPPQCVPTVVNDSELGRCLQYTNLGGTIAKSLAQDFSDTKVYLSKEAAAGFPDPKAYAGCPGYMLALQQPGIGGQERVWVTSKGSDGTGVYLAVVRHYRSKKSELRAWPAGTVIGWDAEGQWVRPLSAFKAGQNGLPADDIGGARGLVRYRSWEGNHNTYNERGAGYYGHADYHNDPKYANWKGAAQNSWDGDEYWVQFRIKISASRWQGENANASRKLLWLGNVANLTPFQELVLSADKARAGGGGRGRAYAYTCFNDGRAVAGHGTLSDPQGAGGSYAQPGSGPPTVPAECRVGGPYNGCWEWPVEEWVTVLAHVKPGHVNDFSYGESGAPGNPAPKGSISVSSAFRPTNDGSFIVFETNAVPQPATYVFKGASYVSNQTPGYFKGWLAKFHDGPLAGSVPLLVHDYQVVDGRARWTLVNRNSKDALPSGIPSAGGLFGVIWNTPQDATYRDTQLQIYVARAGATEYTPLIDKADFAWIFGDTNKSDFTSNPPGFNVFQPSSYWNVQDGSLPPDRNVVYSYAQIIMSKSKIPCPKA